MPIVRVEMWSGRTEEVKKNLGMAITKAVVETVGCPVQAVTVVIDEIPKDNWVIAGQPCGDPPKDIK